MNLLFLLYNSKKKNETNQKTDSSHGPLRLGYVPLKKPEVFWFIAVPIGHNLSPCLTVEPVTEEERRLLCQLVEGWVSPFSPSSSFSSSSSSSSSSSGKRVADFVSLIHHSSEIIRTDINKIPNVSSFKWHKNGKVTFFCLLTNQFFLSLFFFSHFFSLSFSLFLFLFSHLFSFQGYLNGRCSPCHSPKPCPRRWSLYRRLFSSLSLSLSNRGRFVSFTSCSRGV